MTCFPFPGNSGTIYPHAIPRSSGLWIYVWFLHQSGSACQYGPYKASLSTYCELWTLAGRELSGRSTGNGLLFNTTIQSVGLICNLVTVFYALCQIWKASANKRSRYICNVFSHWLKPCSRDLRLCIITHSIIIITVSSVTWTRSPHYWPFMRGPPPY